MAKSNNRWGLILDRDRNGKRQATLYITDREDDRRNAATLRAMGQGVDLTEDDMLDLATYLMEEVGRRRSERKSAREARREAAS
jgi:hypothetical protein